MVSVGTDCPESLGISILKDFQNVTGNGSVLPALTLNLSRGWTKQPLKCSFNINYVIVILQ